MNDDIMNLEETTKFLKYKDTETIRRLCKSKKIPYMRVAGEYRFSKIAISMWVAGLNVQQVYGKMATMLLEQMKEVI